MSTLKILLIIATAFCCLPLSAAERQDALEVTLRRVYRDWRTAFTRSDYDMWKRHTAAYRQRRVRNQCVSEKRAFPKSVFDVPVKPPSLRKLKCLGVLVEGRSAAATFFGKVDFGVGGKPKDNALTLLFVLENQRWKYDTARYFNLEQMKGLRAKLAGGEGDLLDEKGFQPLESVPPVAPACRAPRYIAKLFVDCPGRIVKARINGISKHEFADTRTAEIIWGGADLGSNTVSIDVSPDPEAEEIGPLQVAVYLMPQIPGNVPVKAFEITSAADETPEKLRETFVVDAALLAKGKPKPKP